MVSHGQACYGGDGTKSTDGDMETPTWRRHGKDPGQWFQPVGSKPLNGPVFHKQMNS